MTARLVVEADPGELGFDVNRLGRLDGLMNRYVDEGKLPGWSIVISRAGRVVYLGYGGVRDLDTGLAVNLDTIFRIYSMSKPITSVAAMMLYERGAFELTDPISRYLPEFGDMQVWSGGSDLKPKTIPAVEPIRVWHLLTHTAGFTYGFHRVHPVDGMHRAAGYEWGGGPVGSDLAGVARDFAAMPLLFQPGAEWNYSVATDVLGRLIEVVCGQPLDQFFQDHILGPLEMRDTSFVVTEPDRLATLYSPTPSGTLARNDVLNDRILQPRWLSGGGGLASTLGDYHRFTQLLRGRGRYGDLRLLSSRTMRYMTTNHLPGNVDLATYGRPLFAEAPFDGVGFGLGFSVVLDPARSKTLCSVGEFAWGGAASTAFWVDPVEDITVVMMTQLLPSSTYPVRSQLRQRVYSALID